MQKFYPVSFNVLQHGSVVLRNRYIIYFCSQTGLSLNPGSICADLNKATNYSTAQFHRL